MDTTLIYQIIIGAVLAALAAVSTYLHSRLTTLESVVVNNHAVLQDAILQNINAKPKRFGYFPEEDNG